MLELGLSHWQTADFQVSSQYCIEAAKAARACDPFIHLRAVWHLAVLRSADGDHRGALQDLERLHPVTRALALRYPAVYGDFLNSLAVEMSAIGRNQEAKQIISRLLALPIAERYPSWRETADEIADNEARGVSCPLAFAIGSVGPPTPPASEASAVEPSPRPSEDRGIDGASRCAGRAVLPATVPDAQEPALPIARPSFRFCLMPLGELPSAQAAIACKMKILQWAGTPPSARRSAISPFARARRVRNRQLESVPVSGEYPRFPLPRAPSRVRPRDRKRCDVIERVFACVHPRDPPIVSGFRPHSRHCSKPQRSHTARPGRVQARAPAGASGVVYRDSLRVGLYPFTLERGRIQRARSYWWVPSCRSRGPPYSNRRRPASPASLPALSSSTRRHAHSAVRSLPLAHQNRKRRRCRCDSADRPKWQADGCKRGKFHPSASAGHTFDLTPNLCPWRTL